jgi:hypothetical protein
MAISLGATNGVVIRWPAKGSAFVLEATDDLTAGSWSVVEGLTMDVRRGDTNWLSSSERSPVLPFALPMRSVSREAMDRVLLS